MLRNSPKSVSILFFSFNNQLLKSNMSQKQFTKMFSNKSLTKIDFKRPIIATIAKRSFNTTQTETVNEKNRFLRSENVQTIETITITNVNKYERIRIKSPFNLDIHPLSPREYPLMNKVFLTLYGDSSLGFNKAEWRKMFDIQYDEDQGTLNIINTLTEIGEEKLIEECAQTLECHLSVPYQAGISVECTTNNNVKIHNLDSKEIFVNSKKGECVLNNLKANSIIVNSDCGNIECFNSLHGNIDFQTNKCGTITTEKLIGSFVKLRTENNDIVVKALYAENFNIKSKKSNVLIKNAKGDGVIDLESGKIDIGSMDGHLNLQNDSGDVKILFSSSIDNSALKVDNGDVTLSLLENINANIQLLSKRLFGTNDLLAKFQTKKTDNGLLSSVGKLGNDSKSNISVIAPKGKITVSMIDWFSTLKLK